MNETENKIIRKEERTSYVNDSHSHLEKPRKAKAGVPKLNSCRSTESIVHVKLLFSQSPHTYPLISGTMINYLHRLCILWYNIAYLL